MNGFADRARAGCRISRESLSAGAAERTRPSRHSGCRRSLVYSHLQGPLCRRVLCGPPRRRRLGGRAEMCGSVLQRAPAQCLNYLRASGRSVCLLVNFQKPKVEWKRIVHGFPVSEPFEMPAVARQIPRGLPIHFSGTTYISKLWAREIRPSTYYLSATAKKQTWPGTRCCRVSTLAPPAALGN